MNSEVAASVQALPPDVRIWTNDPFAIWALTDRRDVDETPRSGAYRSDIAVDFPPAGDLPDFCRPTVLVWFDNAGTFHHPPARIEQDVVIYEPIGRADGTLWTVAPPFDCD